MNTQGLSLFQGSESIQLNTSVQQRLEEEDALEDQRRRNEELKNELQNAFDDLDEETDDEDSESCNSSKLSLHSRNKIQPTHLHLNGGNDHSEHHSNGQFMNEILNGVGTCEPGKCAIVEHEQLVVEIKYLKNVINSKDAEIKNITSITTAERAKLESNVDELRKRLSISEAEKERAHMNRNQEHELLVESKKRIAEQSNEIAELNVKIKLLDSKNLELLTDLEHTRTMLTDIQHKYHMVERNANAEKRSDVAVRQINEQHAAQVDMMQQQIYTMTAKLESRDNELKRLQIQYNELQSSREAILIDKSDTINRLNQQLDASQRQCQQIISKSSASSELEQEVLKLRRLVSVSEQQVNSMQRTISNLTSRLETTAAELEVMADSAIFDDTTSQNVKNLNTPTGRPRDPLRKCTLGCNSSTPIGVEDRMNHFKQEFNRCLADQREKRLEILRLKEQLHERNEEIQQLQLDENKALVERNTNKEMAERLSSKLKMAEAELALLKGHCRSHTNSLNDITDKSMPNGIRMKPLQAIQQIQLENNLKDSADGNDELQTLPEEKTEDCAVHKQHTDNPLKECQEECYNLKNLFMATSSEKDDLVRELGILKATDIGKKLSEQCRKVTALENALNAAETKCKEMNRLLEAEKQNAHDKIEELESKHRDDHTHVGSPTDKRSCMKCIDLATKIAQIEIQNLQIQTSCSNYLKEIHDLKKSLKKSERAVADMEKHSILRIEHDQLIEDMKKKAEQFEQFMLNNKFSPVEKRSVETNTSSSTARSPTDPLRDQGASTQDLFNSDDQGQSGSNFSTCSTEYRAIEKRIRAEMSRVMASKIKAYENQIKEDTFRFNEQIKNISHELENTRMQLNSRENDISALKQCILSERATTREVIEKKDLEAELALEKQRDMLVRGCDQLKTAHQQIEHLSQELNKCSTQMMTERQSMEKLMRQWDTERHALIDREVELKARLTQMQANYQTETEKLRLKIVSAKKTATNYKRYSEEKERHIQEESERIKLAYERAVQKVKDHMSNVLRDQEKKTNKRIAELESKYAASLTTNSDNKHPTSSVSSQNFT